MYSYLATPFRAALTAISLGFGTNAGADTVLMMAEEPGCMWCARWNAEIAPIYPKTGEGQAAPLRRVDITQPLPDDISLVRRVTFTPTFVLLIEGQEVSRLEGYPGEDFFWGLLARLLDEEGIAYDTHVN